MIESEVAVRPKLPFELVSTSLAGAFTTPAPPAGFDPQQRDRLRAG
jgi:hypothetical protein